MWGYFLPLSIFKTPAIKNFYTLYILCFNDIPIGHLDTTNIVHFVKVQFETSYDNLDLFNPQDIVFSSRTCRQKNKFLLSTIFLKINTPPSLLVILTPYKK